MENNSLKSSTFKKLGFLFLLLGMPILWVMFNKTGQHYSKKLPIYFDIDIEANGDTIYHTIQDFRLINQLGDSVTLKTVKNKIWLANFFFASCESVCPAMNGFIRENIFYEFEKDSNIRFISFTVDPENDSPSVLKEYQNMLKVKDSKQWMFLTGNKKTIYNLAAESFKIAGAQDQHQGLFHSEKLVLIDEENRVRGMFDTQSQNDKKAIIDAVRALKLEYLKK